MICAQKLVELQKRYTCRESKADYGGVFYLLTIFYRYKHLGPVFWGLSAMHRKQLAGVFYPLTIFYKNSSPRPLCNPNTDILWMTRGNPG